MTRVTANHAAPGFDRHMDLCSLTRPSGPLCKRCVLHEMVAVPAREIARVDKAAEERKEPAEPSEDHNDVDSEEGE